MNPKVKAILFWVLITICLVVLSQTVKQDLKGTLLTGAFVVPFVALVFWFLGRFAGPRKRTATIVVDSALAAVVAGSVVVWELIRSATGFWERKSLVEAVVASMVFLACASVSIGSFLRLRKSVATN